VGNVAALVYEAAKGLTGLVVESTTRCPSLAPPQGIGPDAAEGRTIASRQECAFPSVALCLLKALLETFQTERTRAPYPSVGRVLRLACLG